jgi:hypothetical protein
MVAAMRATVLVGRGVVPALLLGALVGHADGVGAGVTIAIAFLGVGYLLVSGLLVVRPRRPFAQQSSPARGSTAIWLASPLSMAAIATLSPAFLLAMLPAYFSVPGALAFAGTSYAFGRVLGIWASGRYERAMAVAR